MTEFLLNDQTIDSAIATAQQIYDCLNTGNMSAYIWWKCIGDANGLISSNGVPQKRGFVMAQFSRFVRPGFNRIGATNSGSAFITAFRNTNTTAFVIVAINPTGIALTPAFNLHNFLSVGPVTPWITSETVSLAVQTAFTVTNGSFTYELPPLSVVTFTGQMAVNTPPMLAAVPDQVINAGVTLLVTNAATDTDSPPQSLTYTLLNAPTNAGINPSNGIFAWRPLVGQANTTNPVVTRVTDNGAPPLSATNSFKVSVNPIVLPVVTAAATNGQIELEMNGMAGPDYTLMVSTNLFHLACPVRNKFAGAAGILYRYECGQFAGLVLPGSDRAVRKMAGRRRLITAYPDFGDVRGSVWADFEKQKI